MMPVSPPAVSASISTAGNQNRRRMCLRSPGGELMIAVGRYALRRLNGGLAAMCFQPRDLRCFRMHNFETWIPKAVRLLPNSPKDYSGNGTRSVGSGMTLSIEVEGHQDLFGADC